MLPDWLHSGFEIAEGVVAQLDAPSVSVFWGYLASAAVIAFAVYVGRSPDARPSLRGFLDFVVPRSVRSHWLQHRVALSCEFHEVHHSAQTLAPFTAFRRNPVDLPLPRARLQPAAPRSWRRT